MKIKSIILPLFAVFAFAVSPVAVADKRGDESHGEYLGSYSLIHATSHNDIAEVKRLLDGGANPNAAINEVWTHLNGRTALMEAVIKGHAEIVKILLSDGANPNAATNDGHTALMGAASKGHAEFVKMLLAAGANPNAVGYSDSTALFGAAEQKKLEIMKILLSAGANPNIGLTALDMAKKYKYTEVISILQNFRPSVSPEEYIAGLQAEYCGDIATIECQENVAEINGELDESASAEEYAFRQFSEMSENEQAEFCISIRSPQRPCFCTTGIVCTENYCIDRPNCIEPEDADYKHLLNNYIPPEESVAEESANESAADESVVEEPAKPETKTVCRAFANGINPDNTQWGRIGASEAGVGETEYAAIRAAIRICENDGLTECQTDLEVKCEEVVVQ